MNNRDKFQEAENEIIHLWLTGRVNDITVLLQCCVSQREMSNIKIYSVGGVNDEIKAKRRNWI